MTINKQSRHKRVGEYVCVGPCVRNHLCDFTHQQTSNSCTVLCSTVQRGTYLCLLWVVMDRYTVLYSSP